MDLVYWVKKASGSRIYLALLNAGLRYVIPFNKPHGIRVTAISDNAIEAFLPYRKRNFNHIRGLHACALATLAEFTTGMLLVSRLDPKQFRLIMQSMHMQYHYQGRKDAVATYAIEDGWLDKHVFEPLKHSEAVLCACKTNIADVDGNLLVEGRVEWQVKSWARVRTKSR